MSRKPFVLMLAVMLTALALVAAGCGGGGDKNASDEPATTQSDTTTTEETTEETTTSTEETTTTEETTEETTTEAASTTEETTTEETTTTDGGGPTSFATAENCREFAESASKISEALSGTGTADMAKVAEIFKRFADAAPDDIKPDFQVLADAYGKIAEALKGVDLTSSTPDPAALQKLQKLGSSIDQAALTKASQNIAAWAQNNCKGA